MAKEKQSVWSKVLGILAYLHVLVIISLIFGRKDGFVKYHTKQGLVLLLVFVIGFFTFFVPLLPWLFAIYWVIGLVIGIVNVLLSKERPLPLLGKWAESINI